MDLHAALDVPMQLAPGAVVAVPTGLAMAIPRGYEGQVRPRSGLAAKHAVTVVNAPGTVDSDFRGTVMVLLINHGREAFTINHGDRIAQMVIAPVSQADVVEVDALDETVRGAGGFGSTGR
jgi:dUTP pyrophosphatase